MHVSHLSVVGSRVFECVTGVLLSYSPIVECGWFVENWFRNSNDRTGVA